MVKTVMGNLGRIDILVNNAGINWSAPPEDYPLDKWDSIMDVNAKGTLNCIQQIGKIMMRQMSGNIVNISSATGVFATEPDVMQAIGYQASKAAITIMTKQLAFEWAKYNIRVNAIAPFFFETRMTKGVIDKVKAIIHRHVPMGRVGEDWEIQGTVLFLASNASSYITGQTIMLDGGMSAW